MIPALGNGLLYVEKPETLKHLVLTCLRLGELFPFVKDFVEWLWETCTIYVFIFVPKHTRRNKPIIVLIILKLIKTIWHLGEQHEQDVGSWLDRLSFCFRVLVSARRKVGHAYSNGTYVFQSLLEVGPQILFSLLFFIMFFQHLNCSSCWVPIVFLSHLYIISIFYYINILSIYLSPQALLFNSTGSHYCLWSSAFLWANGCPHKCSSQNDTRLPTLSVCVGTITALDWIPIGYGRDER